MGHRLQRFAGGMSLELPVTLLDTVFTSARVFLVTVFLMAGIPKFVVSEHLSNTLRALGVQRRGTVVALRIGVPIAETTLGVWLLMGSYPAAASFTAAAMLTAFTYVLVLLRERDAGGCACFLWDDSSVGVAHVVRNLVLVTVATVIGIATLVGWYTWEPVWKLPTQSALVVAASVLFVFLVYALIATSLQIARNVIADS